MSILVCIPARLSATRLPNKPLADIHGAPMIVRVMHQAQKANVGPVIIACCGEEIKNAVEAHGGIAVLTHPDLPSGTDRVFAALKAYDDEKKYKHIINVQGDLPLVNPSDIKTLAQFMLGSEYDMMTLAAPFTNEEDKANPNIVKIAMKDIGVGDKTRAHYFSRSPIPNGAATAYHHIGIYGYTRHVLERFIKLKPSYLEITEKLEQLRAIEAGIKIDVVSVDAVPQSVDTLEDLENVRRMMDTA